MIKKATQNDLSTIYDIAQSNTYKKNVKQPNGFLVSAYSIEKYKKFIDTLNHFYVFKKDNIVVGFLLAFNPNEIDPSSTVQLAAKQKAKNPFIILKQICVDKNNQNQGIGKSLYQYFMSHIDEDIYLAIVLEPYNHASIKFHKHFRFYLDFEMIENDGINRGVLYWNNPKNKPYFDKEILLQQYHHAHQLYLHEDQLNWTKVNHLFYISASLVAALVLLNEINFPNSFKYGLIILSLIGLTTTTLFILSIFSGVHYMHNRKESYVLIEKLLESHGGAHVIDCPIIKNKKMLIKSPTERMLKTISFVIALLWLIVLGIGIFFS